MTNKLQAMRIEKRNLYTYNEINKLSQSNIECGALAFYSDRKSVRVLVNMCKRLKAIEGNNSPFIAFSFYQKKDGVIC